ncbi:TetR/AcrR family transcriptional regulator [Kineococcus sp. SYSU DK005]|uniref:TetR/AcrR family transcriptional regulator n=1 Tax=Kineococcus sp. SYSU DK005 TaxID=3383126 RepID=UPI003D7F04D1
MSGQAGAGRVGRPRTRGRAAGAGTAREEILRAAAALFGEFGYAATSTRAIADRVGVRQASLYYHFAGKDEILAELLEGSVRPTLDVVDAVRAVAGDPAAALYALVVADVETLLAGPPGIAALYTAPEVRQPRFDLFREHRQDLLAVYTELAADLVPADHPVTPQVAGAACMHLVEMVGALPSRPDLGGQIALCCLGVVGITGEGADRAARTAARVAQPAT